MLSAASSKKAGIQDKSLIVWFALTLGGIAALPQLALAAEVAFTAEVDRKEISQDESVALKLSVRADGQLQLQGPPGFSAPDFDLVNEFTSTSVESFYEDGKFGIRNNQQFTKILRPRKSGNLKIDRIEVQANGQTTTASPITIHVVAGGGGTQPPAGYGGAGAGLRGAGKRPPAGTTGFFVRAEVSQATLYKGQQLIVSYYLYRRARVFNIQVDKYPMLNSFLREDLEIPVLGQRLDNENVSLDGVSYERSLLARYAAYPLKEGKLAIDPMAIKANYYNPSQFGMAEGDDPFMGFFNQLAPRVGTSTSDPVSVEVLPLPKEGSPASFTGGIGNFQLSASVDKGEVKANEAVTLTVSVQGKGNIGAIEAPKVQWPAGLELYESKGKVKGGKGGFGEKTFEFLLVPRASGRITLPSIEMSFFDPEKKSYVTQATQPIEIQVAEGLPAIGSQSTTPLGAPGSNTVGTASGNLNSEAADLLAPLKGGEGSSGPAVARWGGRLLQVLIALGWLALAGLIAVLGTREFNRHQARKRLESAARILAETKSWSRLAQSAEAVAAGSGKAVTSEMLRTYELLCGAIYDAIDRECGIGSRSYSRAELGVLLTEEHGLPTLIWERLAKLLEYAEMVRFASQSGMVSDQIARAELPRWVSEGQSLAEALTRRKARSV